MLKKIIIRYFLLKIQIGKICINDKLLSENQLKIKFNCNRHTGASALKELANRNLLKYTTGVGYYLIKTFEQNININSYVSYSKVKQHPFVFETFPIRLLLNFSFSNYVPKLVSDYYIDDVHNATQYFFLAKKIARLIKNGFVYNNIFKQFAYYGITILDVKKQISFINNDKAYLDIKDNFIIVLKLILYDENANEIAILYNLLSNKYFMVKKKNISL